MEMINKITKQFGDKILRRSALGLEDGAKYLKYFMNKEPINNALEIGTLRGITSSYMSQYCKKLYTIDLCKGQIERVKEIGTEWANTEMRHEVWKYLNIDNIEFKPVKDNADKKILIDSLDFDFAFIDGDHSYKGVEYDFNLVKRCGRVLFHDYDQANRKACPVRDFIKSIKEGNIETSKDYAYWTSNE